MHKSVEDAKAALIPVINKALATKGVWDSVISPMGGGAGHDPMEHHAMGWFERHPPQGWHIQQRDRASGCVHWTVTVE